MAAEGRRNVAGNGQPTPRRWAPRMWLGCSFLPWMRLLVRNRFAVGWNYWYIAAVDTAVSFANTCLRVWQDLWLGRRVAATRLVESPVFIIGHWRSGTTLLHELLVRDPKRTFPTTYECFSPNHFLVSEKLVKRWFPWIMPEQRPMDNMATGWDHPQEDEFALCNLGMPSPYLDIAFPNRIGPCARFLHPDELTPAQRDAWKRAFLRFLRQVTYRDAKRIVLKSPPHTCRIDMLLELFPDACFVNMVRDPYVVFASTVNLWKHFFYAHGLQKPSFPGLKQYVLNTFMLMHDRLEQTRPLVHPSRFYDLRYEDLVTDPLGEVRALYQHFGWDFENIRPGLEEYVASVSGYRPNRYHLSAEDRLDVSQRWAAYFARYGYEIQDEAAAAFTSQQEGQP